MPPLLVMVALVAQAAGANVGGKLTPSRPSAPASRPVQTSFDSVLAGRHRAAGLVTFPVVVLTQTAIQVRSAGRTSYYALAVGPESAYMTGIKKAKESLDGAGREGVQRLGGEIEKDAAYKKALDEHLKILEAAKVKIDPAEAVAIELSGFEARADAYKWETIVDKSLFQPIKLPAFTNPFANRATTAQGAMEMLQKLSDRRPPNLDDKMPDLTFLRSYSLSKKDADDYNAMVQAFNAELKRRRIYAVQAFEEDLLVDLARMGRLLAGPPTTLVASPAAANPLAVETLTKIHGSAPRIFLRERSTPSDILAKRLFALTSVLVTSYPKGAAVTLNGEPKGETPVLVPDLAAGVPLELGLSREGFAPLTAKDKVAAAPDGVKRLEYVLETPPKP